MRLSDLELDPAAVSDGRVVAAPFGAGAEFRIRHTSSRAYRAAVAEVSTARAADLENAATETERNLVADEILAEAEARSLVAAYRGVDFGEGPSAEWGYNVEEARRLIAIPRVRAWIREEANRDAAFLLSAASAAGNE